jgi:outer membrane protein assembly factor BamB
MPYRDKSRVDGPLIVAFNDRVVALSRRTGKVRWTNVIVGDPIALAITRDRVYAAGRHTIACYDYASGEEQWSTDRTHDARLGPLILSNDLLFVGSTGEVECYTTEGDHLWDQSFTGMGYGALAMGVPDNVVQGEVRG